LIGFHPLVKPERIRVQLLKSIVVIAIGTVITALIVTTYLNKVRRDEKIAKAIAAGVDPTKARCAYDTSHFVIHNMCRDSKP
jgi:hypothetical protein